MYLFFFFLLGVPSISKHKLESYNHYLEKKYLFIYGTRDWTQEHLNTEWLSVKYTYLFIRDRIFLSYLGPH